jgi:hypothetical protein
MADKTPPPQSYEHHTQRVPVFGSFLLLLILLFIAAAFGLYHAWDNQGQLHVALEIILLVVATFGGLASGRANMLKVQDRAIRAEENLRHYVLTGKLIDKRVTIKQVIALRFADDGQFPELARQAAEQGMTPDAIKRAVKSWRPDYDRA